MQSLDQRLIDLKNSFEETVTGRQGLATLAEKPEEKAPFNWKKELEEIVHPLMDDLKQLTERPRKMEQLKNEQMLQEDHLLVLDNNIY
ncbi:hypothetical protein [Nitrosomonas sp. Nm34]|uniref:hypothetical protein n=1 Tax=Nitrosomonas sp. Nm34 TaxID=1881055 RepID=UPI0008E6E379|nr:hypothetical protein [Nitrosomonas sp. Nm34]SFI40444.1 hypothetical protein SAMN05428978_1008107 [Nitrosomonas sp. Nm34]